MLRRLFLKTLPSLLVMPNVSIPKRRCFWLPASLGFIEEYYHEYIIRKNGRIVHGNETITSHPDEDGNVMVPIGDGYTEGDDLLFDAIKFTYVNTKTGEIGENQSVIIQRYYEVWPPENSIWS